MKLTAALLSLAFAVTPAVADPSPSAQKFAPASTPLQAGDQKANDHQSATRGQTGVPAQPPAVLQPAQAPDEQEPSQKSEGSGRRIGSDQDRHETTERLLANFTIVLAGATVILMGFTGALWWETRKLAKLAKRQGDDTQKSLEIAKQAADAGTLTASSTRAWLVFTGFRAGLATQTNYNGVLFDNGLLLNLTFRNTGQSPALGLQIFSELAFVKPGDSLPRFPSIDLKYDDNFSAVIGPGIENHSATMFMTGSQMAQMNERQLRCFAYMRIAYRDVFELDRLTEVCVELEINGTRIENGKEVSNISAKNIGVQNTCS